MQPAVYCASPWIPAAWIAAHGAKPRSIWTLADLSLGKASLAAGVCAYASASLALAQRHPASAFVFTSHCDQMRRSFDVAVATRGCQNTFLLNIPATWKTPAAHRLFGEELQRLGKFLVGLGGHYPSAAELTEVISEYQQQCRRLGEAASGCNARSWAEALTRFQRDGSVSLPKKKQLPTQAIPIALVGSPLTRSNFGIFDAIESMGGTVVLNATEGAECSLAPCDRFDVDADGSGSRDNLSNASAVEVFARNFLEDCAGVFQRPNSGLMSWLGGKLQSRNVRGIVLWHYVGCDLWRAQAQSLREAFDLPVLQLDADEMQAGSLRENCRLQAFLELLR